jgi:uncharacterized protein DUF5681
MLDDAVNNSRKQRGRPFKPGQSGNARGRPKGSRNKRTLATLEAAKADGELPLDYMLRIMRAPKASNTRRDEMARTAAPNLHPKIVATPFVPPPKDNDDNQIEIVFVNPKREHVPFRPPPELEAAATSRRKLARVCGSRETPSFDVS